MTNNDWYTWDKEKFKYVLTDAAPKEARKSYREFYKALNNRFILDEE